MSPYKNCPQNSDRVQFRFQFSKRFIIKYLKNIKQYSIDFLRKEITSEYTLFQFERSDV